MVREGKGGITAEGSYCTDITKKNQNKMRTKKRRKEEEEVFIDDTEEDLNFDPDAEEEVDPGDVTIEGKEQGDTFEVEKHSHATNFAESGKF